MLAATDRAGMFLLRPTLLGWKKSLVSEAEVQQLRFLGNNLFAAVCIGAGPTPQSDDGIVVIDSLTGDVIPTAPTPGGASDWPTQPEVADYQFDLEHKLLTTVVSFNTQVIPGYTTDCSIVRWSYSEDFKNFRVLSNVTLGANWNNKTWATSIVSIAPTVNSSSLFYCFAYQQNITGIPNYPPSEPIYYRCTIEVTTGELTLLSPYTGAINMFTKDPTSDNWIVYGADSVQWLDPKNFQVVRALNTSVVGLAFMASEGSAGHAVIQ